nr:dockerin type I repeat-containing protein [uncultured Ruminococcus sp.]
MKKIISILLAVMLVVSVATVSFDAVTYNPSDSYTVTLDTPTCEEAIDACGGNSKTGVQYLYFQLPKDDPDHPENTWTNHFNSTDLGLDYCQVCLYWWGGTGSDWTDYGGGKVAWVGYRTTLVDKENRIYRAVVANDGDTPLVIWNNGVNGGMDPTKEIFNYARQLADANIEGAYEGDYDTLPEGTPNEDNMDGCIQIIDYSVSTINPLTGFPSYGSNWYVYYGDGCYGNYPMDSENFRGKQASCVNPEHNHVIGDVNSDTIVDIMDVLTLQYALAGKELPEGMVYKEGSADVDGDGYISIIDATRIQRYLAKVCNIDGTKPYSKDYDLNPPTE